MRSCNAPNVPGAPRALPLSVLIWTTTPWTLPANVAVALKPEASYGIYRRGEELLLLADDLAAAVFARAPGPEAKRLGGASGTALIGAAVRHPFFARDSALVGADYVELDTGTGAVPHGARSRRRRLRHRREVRSADPQPGRRARPLHERSRSLCRPADLRSERTDHRRPSRRAACCSRAQDFVHSYPHCWRCKNPVIFRATSQWFIALDVQPPAQAHQR